jgi:DNA polymerase III subunit beta
MLKIEVNRQSLLNILQLESRGANQNAELPILSSVLITASKENSSLNLTSTNLNQAILSKLSAKVISDGKIAVPARITTDFLSSVSDETVTLEEGKNLKLKISTKNHQSTIYLLNPEDYPSIPSISNENKVEIPTQEFKEAVSTVAFTASKDDTRPVLSGVMLYTPSKDTLCIVATDSYRLAERTISISPVTNIVESLIIPNQTIQDVLKVIQSQNPANVKIFAEEDQISFILDNTSIISRLVSGDYPAYKNLIPVSSDINLSVDKDELLQTVKVSSLFARESAGTISLQVDKEDQILTVNSIANQVGENHSQISVSTDNTGSVNLNSRYLIEALNSFSDELVDIRFSQGITPLVISPNIKQKEIPDHIHLIMPLNT